MSDCCTPRGYRTMFSERSAGSAAKRYRKRGLDVTSRRIADLLLERGVEGRTILEVGGGIGALPLELLRAGAARAVGVELTPTYERAARDLADDLGLSDRLERRVADFVETADACPAADIVVMNRVVCCYPDMPALVAAAAGRSSRLLVLSFPKRKWWTRILLAVANLALKLARLEFHIFLHPPEHIRRTAESRGLALATDSVGLLWEIQAYRRDGAA